MKIAQVCRFSILAVLLLLCPIWTHSQTTLPAEHIDFARLWTSMPEEEKEIFLTGVRTGVAVPLIMLVHIENEAAFKKEGDTWVSQNAFDMSDLLSATIFSAGGSVISVNELKLRVSLFYLDKSNRYKKFAVAIHDAIMRAAQE